MTSLPLPDIMIVGPDDLPNLIVPQVCDGRSLKANLGSSITARRKVGIGAGGHVSLLLVRAGRHG